MDWPVGRGAWVMALECRDMAASVMLRCSMSAKRNKAAQGGSLRWAAASVSGLCRQGDARLGVTQKG